MNILKQLGRIVAELHVDAWRCFKRNWKWFLLGLVVVLAIVALVIPHDKAWLEAIQQPERQPNREHTYLHKLAQQLSYWGDFFKINLILLGVGLPLALVLKSVRWQRIVLAVFFAALWGGITVNIFRPGIGRPRPSANLEDGINPLSFSHGYHSFPSGHTTTAFATATSYAIICPPATIPVYLLAGSSGWSRMQLNQHHPADIIAGIGLGCFWGVLFGAAVRGRTRR